MPDKYKEDKSDFAWTAPADPRFPNVNQTYHCYSMYCDYHRCQILLGEGHEPCDYFKKVFTSICPNFWIEKWDQQREDGVFPAHLPCNKK